jgi:hypothetical protein
MGNARNRGRRKGRRPSNSRRVVPRRSLPDDRVPVCHSRLRRWAGNQRQEASNLVARRVFTVNAPSLVRRQEERQEVSKVGSGSSLARS